MKKITIIWFILIFATIISFAFSENIHSGKIAASLALLIGAFKARLIFINFMNLKCWHIPFRIIFEIWAVTATAVILGGYYYSEFMM